MKMTQFEGEFSMSRHQVTQLKCGQLEIQELKRLMGHS